MTTDLPEIPPTPSHLGAAGAAFYGAAVADFELSLPELAALAQAAETLDTLRTLEDAIRSDGVIVNGKPSPLLVEARQQRAILVRLLGILDLSLDDDDESAAPSTGTSRAARKAARTRWNKQRGRG